MIMKTLQILCTALCMGGFFSGLAQTEVETETESKSSNKNSSQETVTKIIRIKGPNGEEKVIKQEEVITKEGKIKFNPEDDEKTNQTAVYEDAQVSVQKSGSTTSNTEGYTKVEDGKGYLITLTDKNGSKVTKARLLSNGYYIINLGNQNNGVGHFDDNNNLIIETYDSQSDSIVSLTYKLN